MGRKHGWWSDFTESYMGFELMPMLDDEGLDIMEEMIEFVYEEDHVPWAS